MLIIRRHIKCRVGDIVPLVVRIERRELGRLRRGASGTETRVDLCFNNVDFGRATCHKSSVAMNRSRVWLAWASTRGKSLTRQVGQGIIRILVAQLKFLCLREAIFRLVGNSTNVASFIALTQSKIKGSSEIFSFTYVWPQTFGGSSVACSSKVTHSPNGGLTAGQHKCNNI